MSGFNLARECFQSSSGSFCLIIDSIFSYILIAISEVFASITGLEYAFTKAPKNMRSLVMSIFLFMTALSAALGEAFVCAYTSFPSISCILLTQLFSLALSADPLLVWNYGVMGVLALLTGLVFWWSVRDLDAKEDLLNNMSAGHLGVAKGELEIHEKA